MKFHTREVRNLRSIHAPRENLSLLSLIPNMTSAKLFYPSMWNMGLLRVSSTFSPAGDAVVFTLIYGSYNAGPASLYLVTLGIQDGMRCGNPGSRHR